MKQNKKKMTSTAACLVLFAGLMGFSPTTLANSDIRCNITVCAMAMASADYQHYEEWYIPAHTAYICGWSGWSASPVGGGTATGTQYGYPVPGCTHSCTWVGQSGCGDQGSAVAMFKGCTGGIVQYALASDILFDTMAVASDVPGNCAEGTADAASGLIFGIAQEASEAEDPIMDNLQLLDDVARQQIGFLLDSVEPVQEIAAEVVGDGMQSVSEKVNQVEEMKDAVAPSLVIHKHPMLDDLSVS